MLSENVTFLYTCNNWLCTLDSEPRDTQELEAGAAPRVRYGSLGGVVKNSLVRVFFLFSRN